MALSVPGDTQNAGRSELRKKKKVALQPGKGLMDWVRLSKLQRMTRQEDCWMLLFDMVYDVTQYMEFHPGGADELMRAAGTDGTELFNEEHKWVNFRSMLSSCVIGPFHGNRLALRRPMPEGSEI
uniref:Cytochrome b5 heme-binding domain-containing protein n=1 Tax=Ditylenchus dipsaci TaxID=166011 RepID=A0A915E0R1_9BILA